MSASIGLITNSPSQATSVLEYVKQTYPDISDLFKGASDDHNLNWSTDLAYIESDKVIGISNKPSETVSVVYFYSILYQVAEKFGILKEMDGGLYAPINYDGDDRWILGKISPLDETENPFIKMNGLGLKEDLSGDVSSKEEKIILKVLSKA